MTGLMIYSVILSALLLLFWGAYRLLRVGRTPQGGFSRSVLLALIASACAIAAIPFLLPAPAPIIVEQAFLPATEPQSRAGFQPATQPQTVEQPSPAATIAIDDSDDEVAGGDACSTIYLIGVIINLAFILINLAKVARILYNSEKVSSNLRILDCPDLVPFTWGKWVVMSRDDYLEHGDMLAAHERAHLHGAHWLDLLFVNLVGCITWYCPAAWLLRRALIEAHEYTADSAVLGQGFSAQDYQLLLIEKASGRRFANSVAPCINHSSLKNRIIMMQNPLPAASARKRALALIPVVALAIASGTALASLRPAKVIVEQAFLPATHPQSRAGFQPATYQQPVEQPSPAATIAIDDSDDEVAGRDASSTISDDVAGEDACSTKEDDKVFNMVETMPVFKGGENAMFQWLAMHIRYPENAARNNIQGRVICSFVIEKDGSIGEVKVKRSVDPELDAEAVRVIKSMPTWTPGKMNGEPVRVWYTMPINFKLRGDNATKSKKQIIAEYMHIYPGKELWINGRKATTEEFEALKEEDIKTIGTSNTAEGDRIEINKPQLSPADEALRNCNSQTEIYIDDQKVTPEEFKAACDSGKIDEIVMKNSPNNTMAIYARTKPAIADPTPSTDEILVIGN